jgi:hypothetical protein
MMAVACNYRVATSLANSVLERRQAAAGSAFLAALTALRCCMMLTHCSTSQRAIIWFSIEKGCVIIIGCSSFKQQHVTAVDDYL